MKCQSTLANMSSIWTSNGETSFSFVIFFSVFSFFSFFPVCDKVIETKEKLPLENQLENNCSLLQMFVKFQFLDNYWFLTLEYNRPLICNNIYLISLCNKIIFLQVPKRKIFVCLVYFRKQEKFLLRSCESNIKNRNRTRVTDFKSNIFD